MNLVPREHSLCAPCAPGRRGSKGFTPITVTAPLRPGDKQCKRRRVWTWDQPAESEAQPHSGGVAWGELLCRLGPGFVTCR